MNETVLMQNMFKKSNNSIKNICDLIRAGADPKYIKVSKLILDEIEQDQKKAAEALINKIESSAIPITSSTKDYWTSKL